jgi:tRNA (cmo5U34)-methyltransferase
MKDTVFNKPLVKQFEFDQDVAAVFDDMLSRSVPFYKDMMDLTVHFATNYIKDNSTVYDLGCSTASLLLELERSLHVNANLIGIDNSTAMLNQAKKKCDIFNSKITLLEDDIYSYEYEKCDVMISNYTLQFIRPLQREKLIEKIASSLNDGGVFIFSEKVITQNKRLNKEMIDHYYDFKKNQGYSEYEIMQKREALENVLIPYTQSENIDMIKRCGFSDCEVLFKWVNFATFIAIK